MNPEIIESLFNEESYKDLFDNAHDLIQIVAVDGTILYANASWTKLLEYSLDEIQGHSLYDIVEDDDKETFIKYREAVLNGTSLTSEFKVRYRTKSGKSVVLEGFISLRKKNETAFYTRGIFRDITVKVEDELKLVESKRFLEQLLNSAPDAIIVIDESGYILFWNPKAEEIFEWTTSEVINQPLTEFIIPPNNRKAHKEGMERYLTTGISKMLNKTIEVIALKKCGKEFYASLTISQSNNPNYKGFIAFIRDITQQKSFEIELEKRRLQLEKSNKQLERFAHVASHDMREPIRKIRVFTSRLEMEVGDVLNDNAKKFLHKINEAGERLVNMVDGILNYSIISHVDNKLEPVNLNKIMQDIEKDLELMIDQKKAKLVFEELPTIIGIPFLLNQLFYNLCSNSLKFSKQGVPVIINITSQMKSMPLENNNLQKFTVIDFSDNGIGFDESEALLIFHPFTRLHSRTEYEGTGLGLSLVNEIVERHNGKIIAQGIKDVGAHFLIYFPE